MAIRYKKVNDSEGVYTWLRCWDDANANKSAKKSKNMTNSCSDGASTGAHDPTMLDMCLNMLKDVCKDSGDVSQNTHHPTATKQGRKPFAVRQTLLLCESYIQTNLSTV